MRQLIDLLLQNQVLVVIALVWIGSAIAGALARAAKRAQARSQGRGPAVPGTGAEPAARPGAGRPRPSTEQIAEEIRRMMEVEQLPRPQVAAPPAESVEETIAMERERRRQELREQRRRALAAQHERDQRAAATPPRERRGQEAQPRVKSSLEDDLAAEAQRRIDADRERDRAAEANRARLGTLGGTAAAHQPSRKTALHEFEGRLAKIRRKRARTTGHQRLLDLQHPARMFLAGEVFGPPRALREYESL